MNKLFLIAVTCFISNYLYAQTTPGAGRVVNVDQHYGQVFLTASKNQAFPQDKFVRVVQGSPYFTPGWLKSNFVQGNDKKHVLMRLDLLNNEVHYLDEQGKEMIATNPISHVLLLDTIKGIQYFFVHSSTLSTNEKTAAGWYQELMSGKVSLYKFFSKQMTETLPYGQSTHEQKIFTVPYYYVLKDGELIRLKKITDLEDILADKLKQVSQYIKTNNLRGKSDDDYMNTISMYNQLFK